jgi:hypothetical protein
MRPRLTYANVMATLAAFGVLAGGSAYAVTRIDTGDIVAGAVTAKKLHSGAVKNGKLRDGAVTSNKLADGAVASENLDLTAAAPLAGVVVFVNSAGEPTLFSWSNRVTDEKPSIERTQTGTYELQIPGLNGPTYFSDNELMSSVSLIGGPAGEVTSRWTDCSGGGCLHPIVDTFDSAGNPADRGFVWLVYHADHTE